MKATRFWNRGFDKARLALAMALSLGLTAGLERAHSAGAAAQPAAAKATAGDKASPADKIFKDRGKVSPAEQKAAAKRARAKGLLPGVAGKPAVKAEVGAAAAAPLALAVAPPPGIEGPGGVPHYFGPYGNWAYSPLPMGTIAQLVVVDGGTGYTAPVVTISDAYGTGSGATATAVVVGGVIQSFTGSGGTGYSAPVVTITDPTGTGATATAAIGGTLTGGMRKFVDKVPGLTPAGANALSQYIPLAVPDTTSYPLVGAPGSANYKPASDYYEIALVEYAEKMHSDLPPTRMRGYVQVDTAAIPGAGITLNHPGGGQILIPGRTAATSTFVDRPHFLGPTIVSTSNKPVRIKFYNLLPTGAGGDLFIPVDETVMGSGMGPGTQAYKQNRATVHLHGNNTVWISDGTPHQWTTPAGESTAYPKGVSTRNVPDMDGGAAGPGVMTFYYTNAMSARLMFYHDHAMGITRLNVYAGEAAGYVVTDQVEQDMINGTNVSGVNPGLLKVLPDLGIPLIIQDRTYVDANTIFAQDPTWNWGTGPRDATGRITAAVTGDLWVPHVYMSAQNPWDLSGMNAFGRWHYGPWFWPPTATCVDPIARLPQGCIDTGPVTNPYYQPVCDGLPDPVNLTCTAPWEPPLMPGTPNPSMPGEAFNDTPIVNGTAYPYLEVEPKAYRFRILNAANDRFFNLQLYVAADKTTPTTAGSVGTVLCSGGFNPPAAGNCTEVKMIPAAGLPNQLADLPSGVPDPTTKGPDWIQIGTEGGFLPKPAVVPSQPIGWNLNPTTFNYGNVNQRSLLLGTAERADVLVDFSAYAGKTLILYNDAPAAFPAGVPSYDYFTGNPDQLETGGTPTTQPGYGPNIRTVMQIRVGTTVTTPTPAVTLANLNTVFAKTASKKGVFEASQDPIILPQSTYNSAYNNTFPTTATGQYVNFIETQKTFVPIDANGVKQATAVTVPLEPKAMHDEMGGVYDTQFGRMSGMLGLTDPTPTTAAPFLPYSYASPPTDVHVGAQAKQLGLLPDGTQIWKITHNGVDTHTIHTHLFTAQLINRISMDGGILPPDANELGWKDTFRVNPLEHTIIAMRPVVPTPAQIPFEVPNSVRLIDPTLPEGAVLVPPPPAGWFDPAGNQIGSILNHYVNFGWEYVWHCHILAHEEMDMMHSLVFAVPPRAPSSFTSARNAGNTANVLNWVDNSLNETGFTIQRATDSAFTAGLTTFNLAANATTYTDTVAAGTYFYRIRASNTVGDTQVYAGSPLGFPTKTVVSDFVTPSLPANLGITKTDGATSRGAGPITYTIVVSNAGPNPVTGATVADTLPAMLTGVTWTCAASAGSSCAAASGSGNIATTVNLAVGNGTATFTVNATLPTGVTGTLTNTATVRCTGGNRRSVPDEQHRHRHHHDRAGGDPARADERHRATGVVRHDFGVNDPVLLNWTDNNTGETGYRVQRCSTGSAA